MDKNYRDLFFGESQEYLREINKALVNLETNPKDYEAINVIFRLMHTLKSMAASMEYKELALFAHRLEDAFDGFRSGKIKLSPEVMDVIFENIDALTALIDDFREERPISIEFSACLNRLEQICPKENVEKEIMPQKKEEVKIDSRYLEELKKQKKDIFRVEVHLTKDSPMKGARAFLILNRAMNIGEIVKVSPPEEALREEEFEASFEFLLATPETQEFIQSELSKILEIEKVQISPLDIISLEELKKKEKATPVYLKKIQSMRIPAERLDKIMNVTGELVIAKTRLLETLQNKDYISLQETSSLIERLVASLQEEVLKTRLLPISYILDNFPRIVRDLARKENKEIDLEITGSDIALDRLILDETGDLLIQLVRNAIDHGIELPQARLEAGKSARGKISIKVSRDKGNIVIEISDDGKGIDYNKVMKLAQEKGLLGPEGLSPIDQNRILDILATPGFSTKEKTTAVSGRGVGLDVVKNKLDALGGRLELESQPKKETKFILTLPLTLAIIKAMLVLISKQIYAIPLMNIRETVKIKNKDVKLVNDIELIQLRKKVIPLLRLDKELSIESSRKENDEIPVVIVEGRLKSMGLAVDKVLREQDIVVKPLGMLLKKVRGIAGATILGDGKVAFILDVVNLNRRHGDGTA